MTKLRFSLIASRSLTRKANVFFIPTAVDFQLPLQVMNSFAYGGTGKISREMLSYIMTTQATLGSKDGNPDPNSSEGMGM